MSSTTNQNLVIYSKQLQAYSLKIMVVILEVRRFYAFAVH